MKQNKSLDALKAEWYRKLKDSGFSDIEEADGKLKDWATTRLTKKYNGTSYQEKRAYHDSKEEYYRQASWFLNDYPFESEKEKMIWTMHSEGLSIRTILKHVKESGEKSSTTTINVLILKLAKIMFELYGVTREQT